MSFPSSWTTPPQQPDALLFERAAQRQSVLTKPAGSLGRLENVAVQLAGLQGTVTPAVDRVQISVFVGDHGICEEGVSAYPQAVTAQMIANFANGGAAISVRSEEHTSELQSRPHLVCRLLLEKKNPTAASLACASEMVSVPWSSGFFSVPSTLIFAYAVPSTSVTVPVKFWISASGRLSVWSRR